MGSWIRLACLEGLGQVVPLLIGRNDPDCEKKWIPQPLLDSIVSGILKQACERIDEIRVVAGAAIAKVVGALRGTQVVTPRLFGGPNAFLCTSAGLGNDS